MIVFLVYNSISYTYGETRGLEIRQTRLDHNGARCCDCHRLLGLASCRAGPSGILLATRVTVILVVLVQMPCVHGLLGDDVTVLGEHNDG